MALDEFLGLTPVEFDDIWEGEVEANLPFPGCECDECERARVDGSGDSADCFDKPTGWPIDKCPCDECVKERVSALAEERIKAEAKAAASVETPAGFVPLTWCSCEWCVKARADRGDTPFAPVSFKAGEINTGPVTVQFDGEQPRPVYAQTLYASELAIGELCDILTGDGTGHRALRTYDGMVSLTSPHKTWSFYDDARQSGPKVRRFRVSPWTSWADVIGGTDPA